MSLVNIGLPIAITPFNPTCLENGGLSYRLHLEGLAHIDLNSMGNYDQVGFHLDTRKQCKTNLVEEEPQGGWLLRPTELYLATVKELAHSKQSIPWVQLDPTLSNLGITAHNAGFMERDAETPFELVLSVVQMVQVYPGDVLAQMFFHEVGLR